MPRARPWLSALAMALALTPFIQAQTDLASLLPNVEGWARREAMGRYTPASLYEYINGAADGFVDCGFQELVVQIYARKDGASVTVEIYRHQDPTTAFGIYSQEKPTQGEFLAMGAQGYHEKGILNFFQGCHYVKLSGFQLGARDKELLVQFAQATAMRLPGDARLPAVVAAFPPEGKVPETERFILKNFLGYPFLGSAFVAEYKLGGKDAKLWALETRSESEAKAMLAEYLKAQGRGDAPTRGKPSTVTDKFNGPVTYLWLGSRVLGAAGGDAAKHLALLEQFRTRVNTPAAIR